MKRLASLLFFTFSVLNGFAQKPKLMLPSAHQDEIIDVQFSADDKLMATISKDATIKIWSTSSGKLLYNLTGHTDEVSKVFFSPDGQRLISAGRDNVIKLWDLYNGIFIRDIAKPKKGIFEVFLTRDGKRLIVVSPDIVNVLNPENGDVIRSINDNKIGGSQYASLSPDEHLIALVKQSPLNEPEINIWNLEDNSHNAIDLDNCPWGAREASFYNDSLLVSHCGNRALFLTNVKTGQTKILESFFDTEIKKLQVFPEQSLIVVQSKGGAVKSSDLTSIESAREWKPLNASKLDVKYNSKQNTYLVSSGSEEEEFDSAFILPAHTGEIIQKKLALPVKGKFTSVHFGHIKPIVAVTRNNGEVEVMNSATGQILFQSFRRLQQVNALYNLNDSIIFTGDGYGLINKWEVKTGQLSRSYRATDSWIEAIDFNSKTGKVAIGTGNGSIKLIDATTLTVTKEFNLPDYMVVALAFSHDGSKITGSFRKTDEVEETVQVWDIASGKSLFNKPGHFYKGASPFLPNDQQIFFSNPKDYSVDVYDITSGSLLRKLKGHTSTLASVFPNKDYSKLVTASNDKTLRVWKLASGEKVFEFKNNESEFTGAVLSPDGNWVAAMAYNGTLQVWDLQTRKKLFQATVEYGQSRLKFIENRKLAVEASGTVYLLDIPSSKLQELGKGNWLQAWDNNSDYAHLQNLTLLGSATSLSLIPQNGQNPGTQFYGIDSSDYLTLISSGYYRSSSKASKLLHYVMPGFKIISFEQLDAKYNRPDKVLEATGSKDTSLINSYYKAYQKRIKRLGIDTSSFREGFGLPEADFINREAIALEQTTDKLLLHIRGADTSFFIDRFNLWVNETPLFGMKGLSLKDRKTNQVDTTVTITLTPGDNQVETSISNGNGTESYRMPLFVKYNPGQPVKEKLYFIGIGIDRFADSSQNLQWSVKDIRDLANSFKTKYGKEIVIDTLFNQQVTVSNIASLKKKLEQTSITDKLLLAYSGHGLLSKDFDYYLSTYDIKFSQPERGGLPYDTLENLLDSIPARQKLLLIDACHSGEVDKEELQKIATVNAGSQSVGGAKGATPILLNVQKTGMKNSFELMQELFVNVGRSTGATVISAAGGTQFALERRDLKNGVFTYSILEFMKDHPSCTVSELKQYVNKRVPELTKGAQVPTTRTETKQVDWKVW